MDASTLPFALLALRLGNEKRDVVLLGVFSGLIGAGTAVAAILQG